MPRAPTHEWPHHMKLLHFHRPFSHDHAAQSSISLRPKVMLYQAARTLTDLFLHHHGHNSTQWAPVTSDDGSGGGNDDKSGGGNDDESDGGNDDKSSGSNDDESGEDSDGGNDNNNRGGDNNDGSGGGGNNDNDGSSGGGDDNDDGSGGGGKDNGGSGVVGTYYCRTVPTMQ